MEQTSPISQYVDKILELRSLHKKHYISMIKRHYPDIYNDVCMFNIQNSNVESFSHMFYNYCNNITSIPVCEISGKALSFRNDIWSYRKYGVKGVLSKDSRRKSSIKRKGKTFIKKRVDLQSITTNRVSFQQLRNSINAINTDLDLSTLMQRLKFKYPVLLKQILMHYEDDVTPHKAQVYCVINNIETIPKCKYNDQLPCTFINGKVGFKVYNTQNVHLYKDESNQKRVSSVTEYDIDTATGKLKSIVETLTNTQNLAQVIRKLDPCLYVTIDNYLDNCTFAKKCFILLNGNPTKSKEKVKLHFQSFNKGFEHRFLHSNTSKGEEELRDYIISLGFESTKIRDGTELDIFIPSKNIGIEYNGCYFHSNLYKAKDYHINKTMNFKQKGINVIHVWETEWYNKQNIVKSIISSKLGVLERRIFARKCDICFVDVAEKNQFLEDNHIQGKDKSVVNIGLRYNGELVCLMTFTRRKITGSKTFELSRFCNSINATVIGGASKLFKYFKLNIWSGEQIVTYSDMRFSVDSDFYTKLGFTYKHTSEPNYCYFKPALPSYVKLYHRSNFMKHTLISKLEKFDVNKTEKQNMLDNGYLYIHDCGHKVYTYTT